MAFTIITQGSFTSTGVGVKIPLPSSADYFKTYNITQMPLAPATPVVVMAEWFGPNMGSGATAANDGLRWKKSANTSVMNLDTFATTTASGGFTYVTTSPVVEAVNSSGLTMTAANPAVVTQTNTYSNGDILRIFATTDDLTIGGMDFQISSASGSGYTLLGLPNTTANGLAAITVGTGVSTRRISKNAAVDPEFLYITNIAPGTAITAAPSGCVVSTSVDPSNYYVVGMKVRFSVPSSFTMSGINGLTGTITQLNISNTGGANVAAYNMVVDIDVSTFGTFKFPVSTLSPRAALFATVAPAGASTKFNPVTLVQTGYDFTKQPFHTGQFTPYMFLAGGAQSPAGASEDVIVWQAFKMET